MIMNHQKKALEKGSSEELEAKFKIYIFTAMNNLIQNNICNTFVYCILIIIDNLQLIYFSIHPIIQFLWQLPALDYFRYSLRYLLFNYLIDQNVTIYTILLYVAFGLISLFTTLILFCQGEQTGLKVQTNKMLSFLAIVFNTILVVSFNNVFIITIYCITDTTVGQYFTCYSGIHILHVIAACIGIAQTIFFNITITILLFDYNPKSRIPFAGFQSDSEYARMIMKFIVPFLIVFNAAGSFNSVMIVLFTIGYIMTLFYRYVQPQPENLVQHQMKITMEMIVLWISIVVVITDFIDTGPSTMGLVYMYVLIPPVVYGGYYKFRVKNSKSLTFTVKSLKTENEADLYISQLFKHIRNRKDPYLKLRLHGMLKLHYDECNKVTCPCQDLMKRDYTKEETAEIDRLWNHLLLDILEEIAEKFEEIARYKIFIAYVCVDIHQRNNALHSMMEAEDSKPLLRDEFSLFRFKQFIELEMQEEADKENDIDVGNIVYFQNQYVILIQDIVNSVENHMEFWRELQEDNPNIVKLQNIGAQVLKSIDKCEELFEELYELNGGSLNLLELYANYLVKVVGNQEKHDKLSAEISLIKKNLFQRHQIGGQESKITDSQDTIIITVSGNTKTLGTVFSCTNEIQSSLNFFSQDVIGNNISKIMPLSIGQYHDALIKRYLSTSQSAILSSERTVFAVNKNGYLVPCKLLVKILPNLDNGILMVGFLKPCDKVQGEHYLIYNSTNLSVLNISESMKQFGLTNDMLQQEQTLEYLFKELVDKIKASLGDYSQVYDPGNGKAFNAFIDGGQLRQMYMSNLQESDKKKDMLDSTIDGKFFANKVQVRVELIEDKFYEDSVVLHTVLIKEQKGDDEVHVKQLNQLKTRKFRESKSLKVDEDLPLDEKPHHSNDDYGSSILDEDRQIKDIRTILSTTPKQVVYLRYLTFFIFIAALALSIAKLVLSLNQSSLMQEGINAITSSNLRTSLMADVNLYCRYLQLTALGYLNSSLQTPYQTNISVLVNQLQNIQFDLIDQSIQVQSRTGQAIDSNTYQIQFLLSNNQTKFYSNIFNDALFAYITSASSLKQSTLASFIDSSNSTSTQKNFFYVTQNGLYVLRDVSQNEANIFYNYYYGQIDQFQNDSVVILSVALVIICLCNILYIPIFHKIHQEQKQLLSYFGRLTADELKNLIEDSEQYLNEYIKKFSEKIDENENITQAQVVESRVISNQEVEDIIHEGSEQQQGEKGSVLSNQLVLKKQFIENQKEKHVKIYESKGLSHYRLIAAFIFIAVLLMTEYIVMYVLESQSYSDTRTIMNHYLLNCKRQYILKYNILFTYETLVNNGQPLTYNNQDLTQLYNDEIYANEQTLFRSITKQYPAQFDSYFSFFNLVNYNNLCQTITWINSLEQITESFIFYDPNTNQSIFNSADLKQECSTVKGGLLSKGLRDAYFLVSLANNELQSNFVNLKQSIKSDSFQQEELLRKFILPSFWETNNRFLGCFSNYITYTNQVQIYNFVAFIGFLIIIFMILWFPYIRSVQSTIWKTQRMLTIIPQRIIQKNQALKLVIEEHIKQ